MLPVNRKYREGWIGQLPSRLLILSNDQLSLPDASGALVNRYVPLKSTRTFKPEEQDPSSLASCWTNCQAS